MRFQNWKLYGERGLAKALVTVWIYEGSLKVEYEAVILSKYHVETAPDRKKVKEISNPRLSRTPFRSPQLTLFDLGPHEWLLYWKVPEYVRAHRRRPSNIIQLPLFDAETVALAVGSDETGSVERERSHLSLIWQKHD